MHPDLFADDEVLRDAARWDWQHGIAPTPALRWSVTFRTRSSRRSAG